MSKTSATEKIRAFVQCLEVRRDHHENVYLFVPNEGYLPLEGARARDWLTGEAAKWDLISQEAVRRIIALARAKSLHAETIRPHRRIHRVDDQEVRINLGRGKFIRITPHKITIATITPQIPFLAHIPTLPKPVKATPHEVREELFALLNLTEEDKWIALGWLAATLAHEEGMGLVIQGPYGSGKTSITRLLAILADGGNWRERAVKLAKIDEIAISAARHEVVGIDNLSRLREEEADILAQLITGMAWHKRRLYTDADLYTLSISGKVILNGVSIAGLRADLASRLIPISTLPLKDTRDDKEILHRARDLHPRLLHTICLAIQYSLREKQSEKQKDLTGERMPEWAHTFCNALKFFGCPYSPAKLLAEKTRESEQEDRVLQAILAMLHESGGEISGYASEITEKLKEYEVEISPAGLGKLLRYIETSLFRKGIRVAWYLSGGRTKYHIYYDRPEEGKEQPAEDINIPGFEDTEEEETPSLSLEIKKTCLTCNWYAPALHTATCWLHPGEVREVERPEEGCEYWQPDDHYLALQKG